MIDLNAVPTLDELKAANNRIDADVITARLNDHAESFIAWLFDGRAWITKRDARIGNIRGEPGSSLSIALTGPKRGQWYDHSTKEKGNLIGLYRQHRGFTGTTDFPFSLQEIAKDFFHDPIEIKRQAWRPTPTEQIKQTSKKFGTKPIEDMVLLGAPVASFKYLDVNGNVLAMVRRYEPDGTRVSKTFRPSCFKTNDGITGWVAGMPDPRPLYRLPEIAAATDVILTEGEGKADALAALGFAATSVMGGCNATSKVDWLPLKGKTVTIWPDNDKPGQDFASGATTVLIALGCKVQQVPIPAGVTEGWDAADCVADGGDPAALIGKAMPVDGPAAQDEPSSEDPKPEEPKPDDPQPPPPPPGIPLDYYEDFGNAIAKSWIIKGVMAIGETSSFVGPPGSGKSALLASAAMHAAIGADWRGYPAKQRVGVVYFALERGQLAKRRMMAMAGPAGLPIAIAGQVIDMIHPGCVQIIVDTIRTAEAHFGHPVGLIIIDTFNKGLAAGGGDENKAMDQNIAAANLRRVHEQVAVHICLVGHTGKDESRGARGSNAHLGDVDLMVQISVEEDIRTATITMINDGAAGVLTRFKLKTVTLGKDEDGDDITTAILADDLLDAGKTTSRAKLTKAQRKAMEMLDRVIVDVGRPAPASSEYPHGVRVVTVEQWREACIKGGLAPGGTEESAKKAFRRAMGDLDAMHRIGIWNGLVWIA